MNASKPSYTLRAPTAEDGAGIHGLVASTGVLDVNSSYAYVLLAHHFGDTCVVAVDEEGRVGGFVTAYVKPTDPSVWFLWQVGVASEARGQGLATRMLMHLHGCEALSACDTLETTVSPDNTASRALFAGFARRVGAELTISEGFGPHLFPDAHEPEELLRITPLRSS